MIWSRGLEPRAGACGRPQASDVSSFCNASKFSMMVNSRFTRALMWLTAGWTVQAVQAWQIILPALLPVGSAMRGEAVPRVSRWGRQCVARRFPV